MKEQFINHRNKMNAHLSRKRGSSGSDDSSESYRKRRRDPSSSPQIIRTDLRYKLNRRNRSPSSNNRREVEYRRRSPSRRSPSRRSPSRRSPSRRSPSRKSPSRRSPSRRSPFRRSPSRRSPSRRSPSRRSPSRRSPSKRSPSRRSPSRKYPSRRSPSRRSASRRSPSKRSSSMKSSPDKKYRRHSPYRRNDSDKYRRDRDDYARPGSSKEAMPRVRRSRSRSASREPRSRDYTRYDKVASPSPALKTIKQEADTEVVDIEVQKEAIKAIFSPLSESLERLCAVHDASSEERRQALTQLLDTTRERLESVPTYSGISAEALVMRYRCYSSKQEDCDRLEQIFLAVMAHRQIEWKKERINEKLQNIDLNELDDVLNSLPSFLEDIKDVKPKVETNELDLEEGEIIDYDDPICVSEPGGYRPTNQRIKQEDNSSQSVEPNELNRSPQKPIEDCIKKEEAEIPTHLKVYSMSDPPYYVQITVNHKRRKGFFLTIKKILRQLVRHMKKHTDYIKIELFLHIGRLVLEKRLVNLLEGNYTKYRTPDLIKMYREKYPIENDDSFVLETLCDVWRGTYNDGVYIDDIPIRYAKKIMNTSDIRVKQEIDPGLEGSTYCDSDSAVLLQVKTEPQDEETIESKDVEPENPAKNKVVAETKEKSQERCTVILKLKIESQDDDSNEAIESKDVEPENQAKDKVVAETNEQGLESSTLVLQIKTEPQDVTNETIKNNNVEPENQAKNTISAETNKENRDIQPSNVNKDVEKVPSANNVNVPDKPSQEMTKSNDAEESVERIKEFILLGL